MFIYKGDSGSDWQLEPLSKMGGYLQDVGVCFFVFSNDYRLSILYNVRMKKSPQDTNPYGFKVKPLLLFAR